MKPYETGICVCGKRREDHDENGTCDDLFQDGNGNYVPQCFLDSGIAKLEANAPKLLEALERIKDGFTDGDWVYDICKEAINEALKRE